MNQEGIFMVVQYFIKKKGLRKNLAWKRLLIKGLELVFLCPVFCRFFPIYRVFLIPVW
jgi:hypothetical protein